MTITDPQDLWYISDVVSQVLDCSPRLTDIKGVQAALSEVSLARGREIQMNLVFEEDKLTGFNFAFKLNPNNATEAIYFKPDQLNMEVCRGNITPYKSLTSSIDAAKQELQGHLTTYSELRGEIIVAPPLQVDNLHVIEPEAPNVLCHACNKFHKINPDLIRVAHQLASRNEIDGLLLTGVTLKAGVTLASYLQSEPSPDMYKEGLAIVRRFQEILPQEFADLKAGEIAKNFVWKDPKSNKQYCFKFERCETEEPKITEPISLLGFEISKDSNSSQAVFAATLIDNKYNQWSIEKCDFTLSQIRDLSVAIKPTLLNLSPVTSTAGEGFSLKIER